MATHSKTTEDVIRELTVFAKRHGLVLPTAECLERHAQRFLEMERCPCVEGRLECPCDDVLADVERLGRCECGILIDPVRMCAVNRQNQSR